MPRFATMLFIFTAIPTFSLLLFLRRHCWLPYQYVAKNSDTDISSTEKEELKKIIYSQCVPHAFTSTVIIISMMGFFFVLYTILETLSNNRWNTDKKTVQQV
ncbi:hypothetical protein CAEBREN_01248 [Caenorhabditis brenneri]|uniref:Uncharacterized protein n=1 Tax=Caenorhabditis brenneri TaxID=135651 RepID=G0N4C4_CAEBE|nr:hypothetical protein CAEBREN_01248 [Caenorhabditis brenneri]